MTESFNEWCIDCLSIPSLTCYSKHWLIQASSMIDFVISKAREGNLAILCGAGISYWDPANKPMADPIRNFVLDGISNRRPGRIQPYPGDLSLEKLISLIGWGIEFAIDDIYSNENCEPNAWHYLIARMVETGLVRAVFTTNFDRLIESALISRGLREINDYLTVELETYDLPEDRDPGRSEKPTVWHLHGTHDAWNLCLTLPHVLDLSIAPNRLMPLTTFLKDRDRVLLVLGHSAKDEDFRYVLERSKTKCSSAIILVSSADSAPCFKKLEGCFESSKGVKYCVQSGYKQFVEQMWKRLGFANWETSGSPFTNIQKVAGWNNVLHKWIDEIPSSAVDMIQERILRTKDYKFPLEGKPQLIIRTKTDVVKIVGDIVAINPKSNQKYALLERTKDHGTLIWHVFNRRLRALGYLSGSRMVDISQEPPLKTELCDPSEEELLFYIEQLIEASDKGCPEFDQKARQTLTSHDILHAITHL